MANKLCVILAISSLLSLAACGGGSSSSGTDPGSGSGSGSGSGGGSGSGSGTGGGTGSSGSANTVIATPSDAGTVPAAVGATRGFSVTFTSSDGAPITNFTITSGLSLPAGWSGPSTFTCASVATGSGCLLNLNYAPTAPGSGTLTLSYSYTNNAGTASTGSIDVAYASTSGNNVTAETSPAGQIQTIMGGSQPVVYTFTTDDGLVATNLNITTDLSALPPGWTSPSSTFSCASLSSGNGCQLTLTYAPTAVATGTLTLNYSYLDNTGAAKTGSINTAYAVTVHNNVVGTVAPSGQIIGIIGGTQSVAVTFTTDDGNAATGFSITSDLSTSLPAGWSSTSSSFTCATITRDSVCQANLTYAPTIAGGGHFTLPYAYTDHDGSAKTGTVTISYATILSDNVLAAVSPSGTIPLIVGGSKTVFVTFTTDDGSTATNLALTTNLATSLPTDWSTDPGSFTCATVSTGTSCQLRLFYQPRNPANSSLSFGYSYTNNLNVAKNGTVNIQYRARIAQAYVATGGSTLAACDVLFNGSIGDCQDVGRGFGAATGVAFADDFAYIAGSGSGAVTLCFANIDGTLSNCASVLTAQTNLLSLSTTHTNLYIAQGNATVKSCPIALDGTLGSCVTTGTTPSAGVLALSVGSYHAFLVHTDGNIYHCAVNSAGLLQACAPSGSGFSAPKDVQVVKDHLYVTNSGNNSISVCTIDLAGNGSLSGCTATAFPTTPVSIGVLLTHAYVTDGATNVYVCNVSSVDGTLSNCTATTGGGAFVNANQISVN